MTKLESPWSVTRLGSGDLFFILTILYPLNYFLTYEWFKFNVCQHLNVCTLVTTDRGPFHGLYVLARTDGILALQSGLAPACLYQVRKTFWHYPTFFQVLLVKHLKLFTYSFFHSFLLKPSFMNVNKIIITSISIWFVRLIIVMFKLVMNGLRLGIYAELENRGCLTNKERFNLN